MHFPVLRLAIYNGVRYCPAQGINFAQWHVFYLQSIILILILSTTAEIIKDYLPPTESGKRVDFILHLETDAPQTKRIKSLLNSLALESINHTSLDTLICRPITASIETKRDGSDLNEARLQIGLWHASQ